MAPPRKSRGGRGLFAPFSLFFLSALALAFSFSLTLSTAARLDDVNKLTMGPLGGTRFLLGYNMGNVRFLPFDRAPLSHTPDELRAMLTSALDDMASQGANAVRFWLHIDGSTSPDWDQETGLVSGISADVLNDLKWFLQAAHDRDIAVVLSLWSHDVLAVRATNSPAHRERALKMIDDEMGTDAYIRKALVPMLQDLAGTALLERSSSPSSSAMMSSSAKSAAAASESLFSSPSSSPRSSTANTKPDGSPLTMLDAVWAWEIFNEPEGMSFDLEGYKNYQYEVERGPYTFENPDVYDVQPKRKLDYQNTTFLKREGGFIKVDPKDSSKALYNGPHFVKRLNGTLAGLNDYMYRDVFAQFNSDFAYLLEAVEKGGLRTRGTTERNLARFHNRVAGAIHRAVPGALVTVAAHSMPYTSDTPMKLEPWRPPNRNLYTDWGLVAAGGDPDGTLDFYQVHSYPNWQDPKDEYNSQYMPFLQPKSKWGLDKPLLVGEFWDATCGKGEGTLTADAWYKLFTDGYAGGLGWAYFEVTEEFGGNAIVKGNSSAGKRGREPLRLVARHQMRDRYAPLIREVARRLNEDKVAEAQAALVPARGMSPAEFAALRAEGGGGSLAGSTGATGAAAAAAGSFSSPVASRLPSRFAASDAIARFKGAPALVGSGASSPSSSSSGSAAPSVVSRDAVVGTEPIDLAASTAPAAAKAAPLLLRADDAKSLAAALSEAVERANAAASASAEASAAAVASSAAAAAPAPAADEFTDAEAASPSPAPTSDSDDEAADAAAAVATAEAMLSFFDSDSSQPVFSSAAEATRSSSPAARAAAGSRAASFESTRRTMEAASESADVDDEESAAIEAALAAAALLSSPKTPSSSIRSSALSSSPAAFTTTATNSAADGAGSASAGPAPVALPTADPDAPSAASARPPVVVPSSSSATAASFSPLPPPRSAQATAPFLPSQPAEVDQNSSPVANVVSDASASAVPVAGVAAAPAP